MKIILINPSYEIDGRIGAVAEPLGLTYIAATIEQDGRHQVEIVDSVGLTIKFKKVGQRRRYGLSDQEVLDILTKKNFDIIGVSLLSSLYVDVIIRFIGKLKERFAHIPVVVGGAHATSEWKACLDTGVIDFVVFGEGEHTTIDLLEALSGKKDLTEVHGIAYKDNNGIIVKNPKRSPVNLDEIPWPARHLIPLENYFRYEPKQHAMRHPAAVLLTSRACPYNCVFCNIRYYLGRKWRGRNAIDVVDEMEYLVKEYGVREFLLQDDNFLANPKRAEAICDEIIKRQLDIRWRVEPGIAVWLLTEELLRKMRDSGVYLLYPQIETGSKKTLKYINKPIDFDYARKMIKCANRLGIWTQTNIILGFYFETKEDIEQSIRLAESLGVDIVHYIIAIPYPHTQMFDDYFREGLVTEDEPLKNAYDIVHFTAEEISTIRDKAQHRYILVRLKQLLNPKIFFNEFFPKINTRERMAFFLRRTVAEFLGH